MRRIHPSFAVLAGAFLLFAGLLTTVLLDHGPTELDATVLRSLEEWRSAEMTDVVRQLTHLGGRHFMIPFCTVWVLFTAWWSRRAGVFLGASLLGSALLNEAVKVWVARPRPTVVEMVGHPTGLSFPSGHSQSTAALASAGVLMLWAVRPEWRGRAFIFLALPLSVGWTRGYLGVHYPTDVLAGWSLALVWVLACWTWYRRREIGPFADVGVRGSLGSSESEPAETDSAAAAPPPG